MAKDLYIDIEKFKQGLYALEDTTKAPIGSFRLLKNVQITDRGGVSPRYGTELLGADNSSSLGIKGLYNFKKSFGANEILIKCYDDEFEAYSKNHTGAGWFKVKDGYTSDKEHGFVTSLVNTENQDYVISCNRYEPYQRWSGAITQLNGALAGGETAVTVDSVLTSEVFESLTATSNSSTTLTVSTANFGASAFINKYIHIPSTGKIRKITANTSTVITFDTLGGAPGNVAFEIRDLAFPATGSIIYNGTVIAYSGIDIATAFTVSSAHAGTDNAGVTLVPTQYPLNPRGNRLANFLTRIIVGNVRSAVARDSGGALQGYSSAGSYFVSKLSDPTSFDFTATRVAGEGDIVSTPYGGGDITDVAIQEDSAYIFKNKYIESVKYSQDANDLAVRTPLKAGVGSIGRVIRGNDDVYFVSDNNEITSIGRVKTVDVLPQTDNIGFKIKRLLDTYDFTYVNGFEFKDKIYISCRSSTDVSLNDITLIYSKINKAFEGIWDIGAAGLVEFNDKAYYGESTTANVYELFKGTADVKGSERYEIASECVSHFMNLTPSKARMQSLNSVYFEGYITASTTVTFKIYKDFENSPFLSFNFTGTEDGLLDGSISGSYMGQETYGLNPIGVFSDPDQDGRRHFQFRVYFPYQHANYFAVGWQSQGVDLDYEIMRYGLGLTESVTLDANRVKSIN